MRRYIFNLKNIKTYPYIVSDKYTVALYGIPNKVSDTYIDYGDFKVHMKIHDSNLFEFKTNINWVHPSGSYLSKKPHENSLCLGTEYRDQIIRIISNKTNERQLLEHILYDYFSTCTEGHWIILKIPAGLKSITNDDLFTCKYFGSMYHISNMSKKIVGASLSFENAHLHEIESSDKDYPIDIDNYILCNYCGYISKPTTKKCRQCSSSLNSKQTVKNAYK